MLQSNRWALAAVAAASLFLSVESWAVSGAAFTTVNESVDGTGHCKNGNPNVNCNIYGGKQYVWLTGGPGPSALEAGLYYFVVLQPGGQGDPNDGTANNLSDLSPTTNTGAGDAWTNRVFTIGANGIIVDYQGSHDFANNKIRLLPYDDTPNPGGEYDLAICKLDPNAAVPATYPPGVTPSDCKYDNFKVQKPENATVNVCKFDDQNGSFLKDAGEPFLPAWVIDATGVQNGNGTTVSERSDQTDQTGCVSFTVGADNLGGTIYPITFAEMNTPGWIPTGAYSPDCTFTETDGVVTLTPPLSADSVCTVYFGNYKLEEGGKVSVTKTVETDPISWGIEKRVDKTQVNAAAGTSVTFNYTVAVTHTDPATLTLHGTIKLGNSRSTEVQNITLKDATDVGGNCKITAPALNGTEEADGSVSGVTIPAGSVITTPYTCTGFAPIPAAGTNTVSALLNDTVISSDPEGFSFANTTVNVADPVGGGLLGTVGVGDPSPKEFNYARTVTAPSGTCKTYDNTATITETSQSSSKSVKVCGGADLTASKTATASYDSSITKTASQSSPVEVNGAATLSYTVMVTESGWKVGGKITVTNPNDWEAVSANLSDVLTDLGGACTIVGGSPQLVAASSSISPDYSCTFAGAPSTTSGTNTATAGWDKGAYFTPGGSTTATAAYAFPSLTVKDAFNGGAPVTLGTIAGNVAKTTYTPSYSVTAPPGICALVPNVASIQDGGSSQADVTVCNTNTGALTMGFWKNPNGQGIIKNYCAGTSGTSLASYLQGFHPFTGLSTASTCTQVASYVSGIISGATCTSATNTCNSMLRAQMLATALDVYFSTPSLGGNRIGAYNGLGGGQPAIGSVKIDLTKICPKADGGFSGACGENVSSAFGGATCMTVSGMLSYQNTSDPATDNGAVWYGQNKALQVLAKDAFDAINNLAAGLCP